MATKTPTWADAAAQARVLRLVRDAYPDVAGRPDVRPLYQLGADHRWRVNFRQDGIITSSYRVLERGRADAAAHVVVPDPLHAT